MQSFPQILALFTCHIAKQLLAHSIPALRRLFALNPPGLLLRSSRAPRPVMRNDGTFAKHNARRLLTHCCGDNKMVTTRITTFSRPRLRPASCALNGFGARRRVAPQHFRHHFDFRGVYYESIFTLMTWNRCRGSASARNSA
jgi:hypothetical protein